MTEPDPRLAPMGSLLSKMTSQDEPEIKFTPEQVKNLVEIVVQKFVTEAPGMPPGMSCKMDRVEAGWDVQIRLPKGYVL